MNRYLTLATRHDATEDAASERLLSQLRASIERKGAA